MANMRAKRRRTMVGLGLAGVMAVLVAAPALAANTVAQVINAGTRSASVADLTLSAVSYSHSAQSNTGTMTLTADDSSGSGQGWNVTIQTSALVYSGSFSGTDIPAANLSVTSTATPVATAGQAVDATNGPKANASLSLPATLDTARKVITANAGYGSGTYTQALGLSLSIPAASLVGTYTGTLTTTISSGP